MASNPLLSNKFIYQFGNIPNDAFIFYKGGFTATNSKGLKERMSDASYIDGEVDNALNKRLKKGAKVYDIQFAKQINDAFTTRYIEKIFDGRKDKAFFFETDDTDVVTSGYKTTQRYINKWLFTDLRTIQAPSLSELEREDLEVAETQLQVTMKAYRPYYYDCTAELEYIDYESYVGNLEIWDSVGTTTTWSATNQYWYYPPASFGLVSSLSDSTAWSYFVGLTSTASSRKYFLQLKDRFFDRDTSQTARNYYINATFNSGTTTDTVMSAGMEDVNSDASEYRIEITSMGAGQSVTINNLNNNSGLKITWQDASASGTLVYNSIYGKLYTGANETEVDPSLYTIEIIDEEPLYFTGLHNPYAITAISAETVRTIVSTGNNLTVKIDILEAYV